jgi:tRNA uridine 5-carboxymethylaminomethyl modification enzyme
MKYPIQYDVIVVGAGHAGAEAAAAAANMKVNTLLITLDLFKIAQMSCNPAMGGIAKGQIVREIDAMGGYSGIVSDKSAIQFRMLNKSKGPAMWSPRTQNDRVLFSKYWREALERIEHLDLMADMVTEVIVSRGTVIGVKTQLGTEIRAKSVILTNGTFLNGKIFIGDKVFGGGRIGEKAAIGLTENLVQLGFESGRMKTGTPPRIDGRSLDYSKMTEQAGDELSSKFSFSDETKPLTKQRSCYITYTNPQVHENLRIGFKESPLFSGVIDGVGPRYCPSIEDKIVRFSSKDQHQLFVEPEGWSTYEVYVNGFSSSLSEEVQMESLKKVPGFENAKFMQFAYAIEYDYFPPTQLQHTLETKLIKHLYFAGQINGTTGYEEAAAQGMMAGINAVQKIRGKEAFILKRDEAYIGVLIDDLITKGVDEPYRMFTSRAEYRTLLRQDNADLRLTAKSHAIGLASDERLKRVEEKQRLTDLTIQFFKKTSVKPDDINPILQNNQSSPVKQQMKLFKIASRPQINFKDLEQLKSVADFVKENNISNEIKEQAEIHLKYAGYIEKEKLNADKLNRLENISIPDNFDYDKILSISYEGREKLNKIRPKTIAQASRISGVSPSDISVLLVYMGR